MSEQHPYYECPRFENCSAPKCPLDPSHNERVSYPKEEKCLAQKRTRIKVGVKYPEVLKYKGLTGREYNGYKNAGRLGHVFP